MKLRVALIVFCTAILQIAAPAAEAQTLGVRGMFDIGGTAFTAAKTFKAMFGTSTATVWGLGGEVVLPQHIFANIRSSRFEKTGERVFVFEGESFGLGIDTTVRITPVEVTGGYRFADLTRRVIPYAGGGIGWHHYEETSKFAQNGDDVTETYRGYHVLGGAELRLARWLGVGGEVQWTTVADAIGQEASSAAKAFGEDDLGGTSFRLRIVVGR